MVVPDDYTCDLTNRISLKDRDTPDQALPPLPSNAPLLERGLHAALPEMPLRVVAFLLHAPRPEPPWRYQESLDEKAHREMLESEGGWTG
jgi:hypothetical protein